MSAPAAWIRHYGGHCHRAMESYGHAVMLNQGNPASQKVEAIRRAEAEIQPRCSRNAAEFTAFSELTAQCWQLMACYS